MKELHYNFVRQQGFVIVIVLMVVFLMVTLLAYMLEKQHLLIRRIGNQNIAEQGYHYAQGVNAWAERVLHDDKDRTIDYMGEDWAKFGRPEEEPEEDNSFSLDLSSQEDSPSIDFGIDSIEYSIDDLQGRFNLNNLSVKNPNALAGQKRIFQNLLGLLGVADFDQQEKLYGSLKDWLDENDETGAYGHESGFYQVKNTPYYAADQKMTSIGELRFIEGFTTDIINKLRPYVTVLPVDNARVNLNTTSAEVLASLSTGTVVDLSSVIAFLAARSGDAFLGFSQPATQQAKNAIIGVSPGNRQPVANMMQTNSQFFQINIKVMLGDFEYCMRSIVLRESADPKGLTAPKVSVLNRQHDTLCNEESAAPAASNTDSDENLS